MASPFIERQRTVLAMARISEAKAPAHSISRKLFLRMAASSAIAALLWAGVSLFLYVAPATDGPRHADVLLVLAPPIERITFAEQLMERGYAGTLAISVPLQEHDGRISAMCNEKRAYRIVCFHPDPVTTQGEARALQRLSMMYGWKSANVITTQSHITRARIIIERCFKGDLNMVAYWQNLPVLSFTNPRQSWAYRLAYETGAIVKMAVNQDC